MVAGRRSQIAVRGRIVDHLELAEQAIFQIAGIFFDLTSLTKNSRNQSSGSSQSCRGPV